MIRLRGAWKMQTLNDITLINAIDNCVTPKKHHVGVFVKTQQDIRGAWVRIISTIGEEYMDAWLRTEQRITHTHIEFKNGSTIKILCAKEWCRGFAFHEVLYEKGIDDALLHDVIQFTEKLK